MKCFGIYGGSFDPAHYGHFDIIDRACRIFDEVHVVIAENQSKKGIFQVNERAKMILDAVEFISQHRAEVGLAALDKKKVTVTSHKGLLVDYAKALKASEKGMAGVSLIRGMRPGDSTSETTMAQLNSDLGIDTLIFPCRKELAHISSSAIKEILRHDPKALVNLEYMPTPVYDAVIRRIMGLYESRLNEG